MKHTRSEVSVYRQEQSTWEHKEYIDKFGLRETRGEYVNVGEIKELHHMTPLCIGLCRNSGRSHLQRQTHTPLTKLSLINRLILVSSSDSSVCLTIQLTRPPQEVATY